MSKKSRIEATGITFEEWWSNQADIWGPTRGLGELGDELYGSCYYWFNSDLVYKTIKRSPIDFVNVFLSFGSHLFNPESYSWILSILVSMQYNTPEFEIRYPTIKEMRTMHGLILKKGTQSLYILDGGKKKYITDFVFMKGLREEEAYEIVDALMRCFVYAPYSAYYVNSGIDYNTYCHIRRMKRAFWHDSYAVAHMMWAYALCMQYGFWKDVFTDKQFPEREEVIKRYRLLTNKKTNHLPKTREFNAYYIFNDDEEGYYTYHAMY